MNNLLLTHKDKLSMCILVYGIAGLIFYAAIVIGSFFVKYGVQILSVMKGFGL